MRVRDEQSGRMHTEPRTGARSLPCFHFHKNGGCLAEIDDLGFSRRLLLRLRPSANQRESREQRRGEMGVHVLLGMACTQSFTADQHITKLSWLHQLSRPYLIRGVWPANRDLCFPKIAFEPAVVSHAHAVTLSQVN